tara:strand:+ start:1159 stop:1377 length:219 start_codon:yes stop_codon:yes gene_type:complete
MVATNDNALTGKVCLEPITRLAAIVTVIVTVIVIEHIELIATASTTYSQRYNLARQFSFVDHISHGRAGAWS